MAAHRSQLPLELRSRDRWVRRLDSKIPVQCDGHPASSTNAATWTDFDTASSSRIGAGLGFVLDGDGVVCVDLDHCLYGRGRVQPWAADLLASMPKTYVEVSPSGDGLHVWGFGVVGAGRRTLGIEVYGRGRYLTVTGRRWRGCSSDLAIIDGWISELPI